MKNKSLKILVPTDFSEPANNALQYALQFADQNKANIQLIHVLFPQGQVLEYPTMYAQATQQQIEVTQMQMKLVIEKNINQVSKYLKNIPCVQSEIEIGTSINMICQKAVEEDIDLIIMGSRGTNRSRLDKFLGSVAAGVVTQSSCPIMIIPENSKYKSIDEVAYASKLLQDDPFEVWNALKLLKPNLPLIHCIHFYWENIDNFEAGEKIEKLKAFLNKRITNIKVNYHHVPNEDVVLGLNEFVDTFPIDLVIMFQEHHGFWTRLFHRSATKEMSIHSHVPLLVMKDSKFIL